MLKVFRAFILLCLCLQVAAVFAQSEAEIIARDLENSSIWKKLGPDTKKVHRNIILRLIDKAVTDIDSWGINGAELGIDDGVIAKVIFSLSRSIDQNYSAKSPAEKYLVRDTFKIGMRLGAGLVVSGDVSLCRQYSLIYPVATKAQGAFHNKFILNLFLPYHVAKQNFPPKYVLMVEDFLEGRGRLKLGGTLQVPVGIDTAISAIHLNRSFYDAKDSEAILVFQDQANSSKLAAKLYAGVYGINLPLFNGSVESGELHRQYLRLPRPALDKSLEAADAINLGMWENNLIGLKKFGTLRSLDDKFQERYYQYTAFGLAYVEQRDREDHFFETIPTDGNNPPSVFEHYQIYTDKTAKWMWPTSGEKKYKNIVISGDPGENGQVKRASMLVELRVLDLKANPREIGPGYLHMIDTITRENQFLNFGYLDNKGHWGTTHLNMDIYFSNENLKRLLTVTPDEMWDHVATVTNEPKMATQTGRKLLLKHIWKNRKMVRLSHNIKKFLRSLKKYQDRPTTIEQLRGLASAIKQITYLSESAFSPYGLGAMVDIFGRDTVYLNARFSIPKDYLKRLTDRSVLERVRGPRPTATDIFHPFVFSDTYQIYYFF